MNAAGLQLPDQAMLAYLFVTFVIGVSCAGFFLLLAHRHREPVVSMFLLFYLTVTVVVASKLLLTYLVAGSEAVGSGGFFLQYIESFVGTYGMMLTVPLLAHRLAEPTLDAWDGWVIGLVVLAFCAQHVTEFGASKRLDDWGDVAENVLCGVAWLYAIALCLRARDTGDIRGRMVRRFRFLLLPGQYLTASLPRTIPDEIRGVRIADRGPVDRYPVFGPDPDDPGLWRVSGIRETGLEAPDPNDRALLEAGWIVVVPMAADEVNRAALATLNPDALPAWPQAATHDRAAEGVDDRR